jgi:multidrug transporter EmrE-like cation transporter
MPCRSQRRARICGETRRSPEIAYAIWTGIGAAGTFLVGVMFFGDAATLARFLGAALIIAGVVVLKLAH